MKTSHTSSFLLALLCATPTLAFFGGAKAATKSSPFMDEAVQIFDKTYPFGRDPPKTIGLGNFGMPDRDIDGTVVKKYKSSNKRLTDITEQEAKASFAELAKVYGDERALDMVKSFPLCLAFDKSAWAKSLALWAEKFGEEESKEMVRRNPGLLALKAKEAAKANDSTMQFSYLVAITRPAGSILLPTLLALLLVPAVEQLTGIPLRSSFGL
jgi:hypothetical protein